MTLHRAQENGTTFATITRPDGSTWEPRPEVTWALGKPAGAARRRTLVAFLSALLLAVGVGAIVVAAGGPVWAAVGFGVLVHLLSPRAA